MSSTMFRMAQKKRKEEEMGIEWIGLLFYRDFCLISNLSHKYKLIKLHRKKIRNKNTERNKMILFEIWQNAGG
jgi:hypothetical protein